MLVLKVDGGRVDQQCKNHLGRSRRELRGGVDARRGMDMSESATWSKQNEVS